MYFVLRTANSLGMTRVHGIRGFEKTGQTMKGAKHQWSDEFMLPSANSKF